MADDGLSAAELETLLSAAQSAAKPASRQSVGIDLLSHAPAAKVAAQGPKLPRLSREAARSLAELHENCATQFAADLSSLARRASRARFASVTVTTYYEFAARFDNPTCLRSLAVATGLGAGILEISPAILLPIIDCMLGGGRVADSIAGRPLTDIEQRLAARVIESFLHRLRESWQGVAPLDELAVKRVECDPKRVAEIKADEPLVWIRFELAVAGARGTLHLGLPVQLLKIVEPTPSPRHFEEHEPVSPESNSPAKVELVARLAQSSIAATDAATLRAGDIITTEQRVDAPITIVQDGVVKFHARSGALAGRKAVEIDAHVVPPDDASAAGE